MASEQAAVPFSTSTITGTFAAVRAVPQVARGGASWLADAPPEASAGGPGAPAAEPHPVTHPASAANAAAANREPRMGVLLSAPPSCRRALGAREPARRRETVALRGSAGLA